MDGFLCQVFLIYFFIKGWLFPVNEIDQVIQVIIIPFFHLDDVHFTCPGLIARTMSGPILMKLLGFIELPLNWCNVIFSTSVSDFKPEVDQFFANRKFQSSKPEVEKYLVGKLVGFCNESPIFVFWYLNPGNHQNHFCPGMSIY